MKNWPNRLLFLIFISTYCKFQHSFGCISPVKQRLWPLKYVQWRSQRVGRGAAAIGALPQTPGRLCCKNVAEGAKFVWIVETLWFRELKKPRILKQVCVVFCTWMESWESGESFEWDVDVCCALLLSSYGGLKFSLLHRERYHTLVYVLLVLIMRDNIPFFFRKSQGNWRGVSLYSQDYRIFPIWRIIYFHKLDLGTIIKVTHRLMLFRLTKLHFSLVPFFNILSSVQIRRGTFCFRKSQDDQRGISSIPSLLKYCKPRTLLSPTL